MNAVLRSPHLRVILQPMPPKFVLDLFAWINSSVSGLIFYTLGMPALFIAVDSTLKRIAKIRTHSFGTDVSICGISVYFQTYYSQLDDSTRNLHPLIQISLRLGLLLLAVFAISWLCAMRLEKEQDKTKRNYGFFVGTLNACICFLFSYLIITPAAPLLPGVLK